MPSDCISYRSSGYFTQIITDYLDQNESLTPFYNRFPSIENFREQLREKKQGFSGNRDILANALEKQYKNVTLSPSTKENISRLRNENTFTVTTGHQLNLFTGPLYFLYKIITAINLSKELKANYPDFNFVPVYWMATEDHDFDEISYFNYNGRKFHWNRESSGPVGRLDTKSLDEFFKVYSAELPQSDNADAIRKLFSEAYLSGKTLTEATRYIANTIFGKYGLIIIDGDDVSLKQAFIPQMKQELLDQTAFTEVSATIEKLGNYAIQVNPREINLFYIEDKLRERIFLKDGIYHVNNTNIQFSKDEILELLENHPEKLSPNVIMRPLYQEVILPNLCYIGGGGEIAYWLELKSFFDAAGVTFPILMLRNSALLASEKQTAKADKLRLQWKDLFLSPQELANIKIHEYSTLQLDFTEQKEFLKKQFEKLYEMASETDKSFSGAVKAQEKKQLKGLEMLEKRLLKAEKRKHAEELERLSALHEELFPNNSLQERFANFSEFYITYGETLVPRLMQELHPFSLNFAVITL
ncbi:MAG TPA: bacillithiol biosynthesis cysteine-adding enzyme BshC [Flavobacterium sp.]|jgi:bacillithiol biosynthesis cysteine-adding enzyme BshC